MKIKLLSIIIIILISISTFYAQTQKLDVIKSKLNWEGSPEIAEHNGTIAVKEGFLELSGGKIVGGEFVLNMNNIVVLDANNADHEKMILTEIGNDQFFNVAKFPTTKFKITSLSNGLLVGNLTIIGITKPIQFKTTTTKNGKKTTVDSVKFKLDLNRWGLKFSKWFGGGKFENSLSIQVHIETL